jgi:hypothetical protein
MLQSLVSIVALTWLLAVLKVFILDDTTHHGAHGTIHSNPISSISGHSHGKRSNKVRNPNIEKPFYRSRHIGFESDINQKHLELGIVHSLYPNYDTPLSSEWSSIHSFERSRSTSDEKDVIVAISPVDRSGNTGQKPVVVKTQLSAASKSGDTQTGGDIRWDDTSHLQWPPIREDGSIPVNDGFDVLPIIDLKVPKFWYPPAGADWNKVGSRIKNFETIFLMIASYRDFQCRETISLAFSRADHPERLFIGAVDQTVPGDTGCLDLEVSCSEDNSQPICNYKDQISIFHMDASKATGPVTARHVGDRMYRGQYFVMQMDAHCSFVRHWDTLIIDQWKSTHNEMAVLT